jgi:hypothetical protein
MFKVDRLGGAKPLIASVSMKSFEWLYLLE